MPLGTSKKWYIKSLDMGYFVGEFLGLGLFESHIETGDCSAEEEPIEFTSKEEAQKYLDTWVGGNAGCFVTDVPSTFSTRGGDD